MALQTTPQNRVLPPWAREPVAGREPQKSRSWGPDVLLALSSLPSPPEQTAFSRVSQLWVAASSRLGGRRLSPLSDSLSLASLLWPTRLPVPVALTLLRHTELPSRAGRLLCLRTHHVTEPPNSHPAFRPEFTSPRGFLLPRGESVTYSFTCALRVALLGADVA